MAASTPVHWPPLVVLKTATVDAADNTDDADDTSELICKLCTLWAKCVDCFPCVAVRYLNWPKINQININSRLSFNFIWIQSLLGVRTDAGFAGSNPLRGRCRLLRRRARPRGVAAAAADGDAEAPRCVVTVKRRHHNVLGPTVVIIRPGVATHVTCVPPNQNSFQ